MTDEAVSFLKEFVTRPHEIGAIVPSSPVLARAIVEMIDWTPVETVVEYGPGLGAVTTEIVRKVAGRNFFVIEVNESYADALAQRFPQLAIYRESAARVVDICARHGIVRLDCVISGLPWANFSDKVQDELLDAMMELMPAGGQFATFAYMHGLALPSGRRFRAKLDERFSRVDRGEVVWRNAPPAVVYHCVC